MFSQLSGSQIHERTIPLRLLGIILRVLRLEVAVFITNQFQTTFIVLRGGGRSKIRYTVYSRGECE